MPILQSAKHAALEFSPVDTVSVEQLGKGLINDTFLVNTATQQYVLQRINHQVFNDPALVMSNLRVLLDHAAHVNTEHADWQLPVIIKTSAGSDYHLDEHGNFWRSLSYIKGTRNIEHPLNFSEAEEIGACLAEFHHLANGIEVKTLFDTLPGFHITTHYLAQLDEQLAKGCTNPSKPLDEAILFVEARRTGIDTLESALKAGEINLKVVHGDPKLDNFLFDKENGKAVSLIDLDTVKPGLIHHDLGDCLRSCCNQAGETGDTGIVEFNTELCRAVLTGYFGKSYPLFDKAELDYLYDAIRLLPLELGIRFLTDYLGGNVYFKVTDAEQNLRKALLQFQLVASIESSEHEIRKIIHTATKTKT